MKIKILGKSGLKTIDLNRRKAIRERCLNCSGWYSNEVTNCTFLDCPLYPFRDGRGKQDAKTRVDAIREYCLWCMAGQKVDIRKCVSRTCSLFPYRIRAVDRSIEIDSGAEFVHIEPVSEVNAAGGIT